MKTKAAHEHGQTLKFGLIGSYSKNEVTDMYKQNNEVLFKEYEDHCVFEFDVQRDIAKHLVRTHGTSSLRVLKMGKEAGMNVRMVES